MTGTPKDAESPNAFEGENSNMATSPVHNESAAHTPNSGIAAHEPDVGVMSATAAAAAAYQGLGLTDLQSRLFDAQGIGKLSLDAYFDQLTSIRSITEAINSSTGTIPLPNLDSVSAALAERMQLNLASPIHGSGLSDWADSLSRSLRATKSPKPRQQRTAVDFFAAFEVEIDSLKKLLRTLATLQQKNSHLGLVWRGQENARWAVDSSLTRSLREGRHELGEEMLVTVERFQTLTADRWAIPRMLGDLNFLAELQHEGVPTRLIDVSLDPEVATWFAVQGSEEHEEADARLICWGRSAAPKRRQQVERPPKVPNNGSAFWQAWKDAETRRANDWGTGRTVRSWQPAAMNERMRAQRAAFLFDAEPIIESELLDMINDQVDGDWRADEIAEATRIVGHPSVYSKRATANAGGIVPMFSMRIAASAKQEIKEYLASKGIEEQSIYPDRTGLISYLRRTNTWARKLSNVRPLG